MLVRFSATNFRSIDQRQELSLVASAFYKDNQDILIPCDSIPTSLLPAAVIYGPNAAGKSNFINAVRFLRAAVESSQIKGKPDSGVPVEPFALHDVGSQSPTAVEIEFIADNVRYQYGLEATTRAFVGEWLYWFPRGTRQMLFERTSEKTIKFGRNLKGQNKVIAELMRNNSLYLSAAAQNGHDQLSKIYSYLLSMQFLSAALDPRGPMLHATAAQYDERITQFLSQVGTGIVGSRRKKATPDEQQKAMLKDIIAVIGKHLSPEQKIETPEEDDFELELQHATARSDPVYFNANQESSGTKRLLLILSGVFAALDNGNAIFIDELDASLHTQICESILGLFASRSLNPKGAQLITSTHDTNLLSSKHLRRDQIWFTEKNEIGATHLFSLSDIRTRSTDDFEKAYLQGRYGAIPFAGDLPSFLRD